MDCQLDIYFLEAILNGLLLAGLLALLALGLNLIFGVIDVVWICYAELVMIGMYGIHYAYKGGAPFLLAALFGIALVALGVWRWATRQQVTKQPAWLSRLSRMTPGGAAAIGVGLILVNPKVLVMNAAAGLVIGTAGFGTAGAWLAVAYYTVIAGSTVLVPILAYAIAGERVDRQLERLKQWMESQHAALMAGLLAVVGLLLVYTGIRAL